MIWKYFCLRMFLNSESNDMHSFPRYNEIPEIFLFIIWWFLRLLLFNMRILISPSFWDNSHLVFVKINIKFHNNITDIRNALLLSSWMHRLIIIETLEVSIIVVSKTTSRYVIIHILNFVYSFNAYLFSVLGFPHRIYIGKYIEQYHSFQI